MDRGQSYRLVGWYPEASPERSGTGADGQSCQGGRVGAEVPFVEVGPSIRLRMPVAILTTPSCVAIWGDLGGWRVQPSFGYPARCSGFRGRANHGFALAPTHTIIPTSPPPPPAPHRRRADLAAGGGLPAEHLGAAPSTPARGPGQLN